MSSSSTSQNSTTVRSLRKVRLARAALQAAYVLSEDLGTSIAERLFTSPRRYARPDRERDLLKRARPFEVDVTLRAPRWNGTRTKVSAWRWGFGPTVLLVHGWEGRGSQLATLVEPLLAAGLSVVTFDAPAHGDSPGNRLYLVDHADAIADVADATGPLHAIVSHSFGSAAVLLAYARAGVDAPRNVAIAPNVLIDDAVQRFATMVALDDLERAGLERSLTAHGGITLTDLRVEHLAGGRKTDLLVIHDREDREVPIKHGDRLAAAWPNAKLQVTDGLGHRRILRDPAVLAEIVGFVRAGIQPPVSDLVREIDRWLAE
jgi:pimeloyl-ACP methyl ester carboxylesterase